MSKREKILLYILSLVCILTGGYNFFVFPEIELHTQLSAENEIISLQRSEVEMQIAKEEALKTAYQNNLEDYLESEVSLKAYANDEDIEKQLREIGLEKNIKISDISIGIDANQYIQEGISGITAKNIELDMSGTTEGILEFVDIINAHGDTMLLTVDLDFTDSAINTYKGINGNDTQGVYKVTLVKFMREKK